MALIPLVVITATGAGAARLRGAQTIDQIHLSGTSRGFCDLGVAESNIAPSAR